MVKVYNRRHPVKFLRRLNKKLNSENINNSDPDDKTIKGIDLEGLIGIVMYQKNFCIRPFSYDGKKGFAIYNINKNLFSRVKHYFGRTEDTPVPLLELYKNSIPLVSISRLHDIARQPSNLEKMKEVSEESYKYIIDYYYTAEGQPKYDRGLKVDI